MMSKSPSAWEIQALRSSSMGWKIIIKRDGVMVHRSPESHYVFAWSAKVSARMIIRRKVWREKQELPFTVKR